MVEIQGKSRIQDRSEIQNVRLGKAAILSLTLRFWIAPPPTSMSTMAMEAARIRSNTADIARLGSNEERLTRVPRVEVTRKQIEESSESQSQETHKKVNEKTTKKESKKRTTRATKAKKIRKEEEHMESEEEEEEEVEETSESSDDSYASENNTSFVRNCPTRMPSYISSYEILKLRSVEPTARPSIIESVEGAEDDLRWAANDCISSSSMLRRARPIRPLAASFFD